MMAHHTTSILKKMTALLLCACMLTSLAACGKNGGNGDSEPTQQVSVTPSEAETTPTAEATPSENVTPGGGGHSDAGSYADADRGSDGEHHARRRDTDTGRGGSYTDSADHCDTGRP